MTKLVLSDLYARSKEVVAKELAGAKVREGQNKQSLSGVRNFYFEMFFSEKKFGYFFEVGKIFHRFQHSASHYFVFPID